MKDESNPNQKKQSNPDDGEPQPSSQPPIDQPNQPLENTNAELEEVDASEPSTSDDPVDDDLPTLPDSMFTHLPDFLQKVVSVSTSKQERDILLIGSLVVMSSCLYKFYGYYDEAKVFPNLFLFVAAKASAGKGRLTLCKKLVMPIHKALREQSKLLKKQQERQVRESKMQNGKGHSVEKVKYPPELMLLIPANNSSTGVFQILADNDGIGLIFETEGDTMSQALKTEYGNYDDGLRKGFHHEMISYFRRTDQEFVEIELPRFSILLSGTINQVSTLIPHPENGLLSRFIFYLMSSSGEWKNVFAHKSGPTQGDYFDELGQKFLTLFEELKKHPDIEFSFTTDQKKQFHSFFTKLQDKYLVLQPPGFMASVRRLGLIAFRTAMIFSALRILETSDFSQKNICLDVDFQAALSMVSILVKHSSSIYSQLPEETNRKGRNDKRTKFLGELPETFTHADYIDLAITMSIPERSANRYMSVFCEKGWVVRESHGNFINLTFRETSDNDEA